MDDARRMASLQGAVEVMTAWLAAPDGPPDLLVEVLERRIGEHPSGDRVIAATELVMGMTHLCGSVLTLRELDDGIPALQTLQDLALNLAANEDL